jgi:hypothetical protein
MQYVLCLCLFHILRDICLLSGNSGRISGTGIRPLPDIRYTAFYIGRISGKNSIQCIPNFHPFQILPLLHLHNADKEAVPRKKCVGTTQNWLQRSEKTSHSTLRAVYSNILHRESPCYKFRSLFTPDFKILKQ